MSYRLDLDEMSEEKLLAELFRRSKLRAQGLCDYCGRLPSTNPCKFPHRHNPPPGKKEPPGLHQLVNYLSRRPDFYGLLLKKMDTPLQVCEGFDGVCTFPVLWPTPSMTAYEWDGVGDDPNRARMLCPRCSEGYTETMKQQWDDYNSGRL